MKPYQGTKLQAVLAQASTSSGPGSIHPHHPIACGNDVSLQYWPDGTFNCLHASSGPGDQRTQACLNHSIALLLIELAQ